jgi:hypothetical protein
MIPQYIQNLIKEATDSNIPFTNYTYRQFCKAELKGILWATKEEIGNLSFQNKRFQSSYGKTFLIDEVRQAECEEIIKSIEEVLK